MGTGMAQLLLAHVSYMYHVSRIIIISSIRLSKVSDHHFASMSRVNT